MMLVGALDVRYFCKNGQVMEGTTSFVCLSTLILIINIVVGFT